MQRLQETILESLPFLKKYGEEHLSYICYELDEDMVNIDISLPFIPNNGVRGIYLIFDQPQKFIGRLSVKECGKFVFEDVQNEQFFQILEPYNKITSCPFDRFIKNNIYMYSLIDYPEDELTSYLSKNQQVNLRITFTHPKKGKMLSIIQINK